MCQKRRKYQGTKRDLYVTYQKRPTEETYMPATSLFEEEGCGGRSFAKVVCKYTKRDLYVKKRSMYQKRPRKERD